MTIELNVHEAGCVPFRRCRACRIADIIGKFLPKEMMTILAAGEESAQFEPGVHLSGCSPINPCATCVCIAGLKEDLAPGRFKQFTDLLEGDKSAYEIELEHDPSYQDLQRRMTTTVESLCFSVRTANALKLNGILLLSDLCSKTEAEMLRLQNFGRQSLNEVKEMLSEMRLSLGMNLPAGL